MQFKFSHKCNFGFLKIELFKNSCHSKDFQKPYFCIYILFHNIKVVCLYWHHYCLLAFDWPSFLHGSSHSATCCFGILLTDLQISFCITMWTDIFTNLFKKKLYMWTASVSFLEKSGPFCWRKHAWIWMCLMCNQVCMITKHWRYTVICTETCLPVDDGITRSLVDFQVGRFNARFMILI